MKTQIQSDQIVAGGGPATYVRTYGTGDSSTTVFTVPTYVIGNNSLLVYNDGVLVKPSADYTETSTTSITFAVAPVTGATLSFIVASAAPIIDTISALTVSSASTNLAWNVSPIIKVTMNASTTFNVNTLATAIAGQTLTLLLLQGAGGSFTAAWSTVLWPGGTAPTLTTTAGKTDIVTLFYDGTLFYGFVGGQNY